MVRAHEAAAQGIRRRTFLSGAGGLALSAALAGLPDALARRGWLAEPEAAEPDVTRDALNGLVAFVTPGDDPYSVAQRESTGAPGGLAAGGTPALIALLDGLVPAPLLGEQTGVTLPASALVAQMLDGYAVQVAPAAANGPFLSPFSRLTWTQKAEVFRRIEADPAWEGTPVRYLGALLLGAVSLVVFSDAPRLTEGRLTGEPWGWRVTGYGGVSDGWDELVGYWAGHRAATRAHRYLRHRHPRRRRGARRRRRA